MRIFFDGLEMEKFMMEEKMQRTGNARQRQSRAAAEIENRVGKCSVIITFNVVLFITIS